MYKLYVISRMSLDTKLKIPVNFTVFMGILNIEDSKYLKPSLAWKTPFRYNL